MMEFPGRGEVEILSARMSGQEELPFACGKPDEEKERTGPAETAAKADAAHSKTAVVERGTTAGDAVTPAPARRRRATGKKNVPAKSAPGAERIRADKAAAAATATAEPAVRTPQTKSAVAARPAKQKQPEFREMLARTVRSVKTAAPVKKDAAPLTKRTALQSKKKVVAKRAPEPERTRRITTRFSTAEERRLEKAAAAAGMSVSAWLRKCALAPGAGTAGRERSQVPTAGNRRTPHKRTAAAGPAVASQLFAQPANSSLVGGWLSLLRQRFLGSPARFAERA